jgi:tRNA (guanosine-2'-O-)-methyltransferase
MSTERRQKKMQQVLMNRQRDLTVICENIHDPFNVSAILRTCDAVGVNEVHLLYTREKEPKLNKKTSASALKWVNTVHHHSYIELSDHLKSQEIKIFATLPSSSARSIYDLDWTQPAAVMLGNEHRGVSENAVAIADEIISIPMHGFIGSLNVSVAAAVILYEACRQRMLANRYPSREIDDAWLREKMKIWLK